ncbi:MAG: family 16 glycoside hydrolase [Saprospiraceae bacterium]
MKLSKNLYLFFLLLIFACQNDPAVIIEESETTEQETPKTLPMSILSLDDLSAFQATQQNWQIVGEVYADWQTDQSLELTNGSGLLVNKPIADAKGNIMTTWEHGDLDLEIDFLVPKGSNSGIYLQGRYELQILDSWGKEQATSEDCGGIYQRWDDTQPEGKKGFEGKAPNVNASKAPGLWQHFKIEFQAPRFDEQGQKIKNAIFKKVYQNGFLIHDNVELTGPTRGPVFPEEAATGPLFIQGDHGAVAFKNIKYKAYTLDRLELKELSYEFFDGKDDKLPDFTKLTATKTGKVDSLDVKKASDQSDGFRLRFTGKLAVPVAGDYLFTTLIDDGGELLIDGESVVFNEGSPGFGEESGIINLTKGTHDFTQTFYQEVWGTALTVEYEGPGIIKQLLASESPYQSWNQNKTPILIEAPKEPEMLRAFVNHKGEKKTNVLTIGDPIGVHYSYDLRAPNLIKTWKGKFADVSEMWRDRGEPQRLDPMNMSIDLTGGLPIAALRNETAAWPSFVPDDFKFKGYEVDENNRPTFKYHYKSAEFKDEILPTADGKSLQRTIAKTGTETNLYIRLAVGENISLLPNGLYNIDGNYYIEGKDCLLRDNKELLVKIEDKIQYTIHW